AGADSRKGCLTTGYQSSAPAELMCIEFQRPTALKRRKMEWMSPRQRLGSRVASVAWPGANRTGLMLYEEGITGKDWRCLRRLRRPSSAPGSCKPKVDAARQVLNRSEMT